MTSSTKLTPHSSLQDRLHDSGVHFCLASGSPRRHELLAQLGYQFDVCVSDIEEIKQPDESPADYVQRLSMQKAQAVLGMKLQNSHMTDRNILVLGADTVVTLNEKVFEKPLDYQDSLRMLSSLSNREHQVMTAITLVSDNFLKTSLVESRIVFKSLTEDEIQAYWKTGEPCDKAGSYAIQGIGGRFIIAMEGSYHAVMGLPLYQTDQLIQSYLDHLQNHALLTPASAQCLSFNESLNKAKS